MRSIEEESFDVSSEESESASGRIYCGDIMMDREHRCSIPKQQTAVEDEDETTMDHDTNDDRKPTSTTRRNSNKKFNSKKSVTTEGYTKDFFDYMFNPIYQLQQMISGDEDEQPPLETAFDDNEDQDQSTAKIVNQQFCDMSSMTRTHAFNNNKSAGNRNVDRNNDYDNDSRRGIFVCQSRKGKMFVVCLLLIPIIILLTGIIATAIIAQQNRYDLTSDSTYQSSNTQKADDAANAKLCDEQRVEQVKNVKVLLRLNGVEDYVDPLEREHIGDALLEAYNGVSLGPCGGDKYKRWMVSASVWAQLIDSSLRQSLFEIDAYISCFNCPNEEIFASDYIAHSNYTAHSMPEMDDPTEGFSFSIDGEDGDNNIVDEEMDIEHSFSLDGEQEDGEDAVGDGDGDGDEEEMNIEYSFSLDGEQEEGEVAVGDGDEEEINVEFSFSFDDGGGGRKLPATTTSNFRRYNSGGNKRIDLPSKSIFERRFENVNDEKHVTTTTTRELKYDDTDDAAVVSSTLKASEVISAMEAIIYQKYEDGHISGVFAGISEASVQNSPGGAFQPIQLV